MAKKVDITIHTNEYREVNRQRCLRKRNMRPLSELANNIANASDETAVLRAAWDIVRQGARTKKAIANENNIGTIKNELLKNVEKGDMFTLDSASQILWNRSLASDGAHGTLALLAALDDLVIKGTLERRTMVHDVRSGTSHVNVYVVL